MEKTACVQGLKKSDSGSTSVLDVGTEAKITKLEDLIEKQNCDDDFSFLNTFFCFGPCLNFCRFWFKPIDWIISTMYAISNFPIYSIKFSLNWCSKLAFLAISILLGIMISGF